MALFRAIKSQEFFQILMVPVRIGFLLVSFQKNKTIYNCLNKYSPSFEQYTGIQKKIVATQTGCSTILVD
jgi:hypothetical protein